jgi:hypothetical protein
LQQLANLHRQAHDPMHFVNRVTRGAPLLSVCFARAFASLR